MAIVIGNKTATTSNYTENSSKRKTISHTQNTGSDRFLMVVLTITASSGVPNWSSVTYGGQAMTQSLNYNSNAMGHRWAVFTLVDPPTGANDLVANLTSLSGNPGSFFIVSFTGVSGVGNIGNNDQSADPHSRNITVSNDSIVYCFGVSYSGINTITIDGSSRTLEFNHNVNRFVRGAFSDNPLSAGTISCVIDTPFNATSNSRIELLASAPTPGGYVEGNFFPLLTT
jgi:hypothetical protein